MQARIVDAGVQITVHMNLDYSQCVIPDADVINETKADLSVRLGMRVRQQGGGSG